MKNIYLKYKREIWVGVVVSLITTAIIKFGDWVVAVTPKVGTTIFGTLSNILYTSAATYTDGFAVTILVLGGLGVLTGTTLSVIWDGIKVYRSVRNLEKRTKNLSANEKNELVEKAMLELKHEQGSKQPKSMSNMSQIGKQIGQASVFLFGTLALLYFFIIFFVSMPVNLHHKFERDIVKIAPYVEEAEIIQLKSDWGCMRSKSEYDKIYKIIDQVKEEHLLPK